MKRLLLGLLLAITLAIGGSGVGFSAEEMKTMHQPELNITMCVPELAPEFLDWSGVMLAAQDGPTAGLRLGMVQNEDDTVRVVFLLVVTKEGGKHLVAFAVSYAVAPEKQDIYEDSQFVEMGKPSGKLSPRDAPTDIKIFLHWVGIGTQGI